MSNIEGVSVLVSGGNKKSYACDMKAGSLGRYVRSGKLIYKTSVKDECSGGMCRTVYLILDDLSVKFSDNSSEEVEVLGNCDVKVSISVGRI